MLRRTHTLRALLLASAFTLTANHGVQAADTASGNAQCDGVTENSCPAAGTSTDPGVAPAGITPRTGAGNPISLLTGNKHQSEQDVSIPGAELTFRRVYNSANSDHDIGLGRGWHHSYAVSLFDVGNGAREIVQSDGRRLHFEPDGVDENGHELYRATQPNLGVLRQIDGQHQWSLPDGRTLQFTGAYLIRIDWPDQRRLELFYRHRKLSTVTDETGRVLQFAYTPGPDQLTGYDKERFRAQPGRLSRVTLPDGSTIGYDYDERKNLTRVRYPDGTNRTYHYENPTWPSHLTGLTDRTGVRFASWAYDREGRAISSEHAGGVEKVTLQHPSKKEVASGALVQTRITNSLGQQSTYSWQRPTPEAEPQLLSSTGPGCATCPPTGVEYTYDEAGRLISAVTTGQGNARGSSQSDYTYDAQGRIAEIRQIDALGQSRLVERREYVGSSLLPGKTLYPSVNPDGERSVEIERDAAGLPIRITERGYTPAIDSLSDTPTSHIALPSDTNAVIYDPFERVTRLAYDDGQLVSIDGPRTDVEDVTALAWDAEHRLVRIAPASSPEVRITRHDALGRAVQYTSDALGEGPVSLRYDNDHRIVSLSHRDRTLRFDYDAVGRLVGYTDADGRRTTLHYDAAGQLAGVTDPLGRRAERRYDSEGRLIEHTRLDLGGELIDSLGVLHNAQGLAISIVRESRIAGNPTRESLAVTYDAENRPSGLMAGDGTESMTLGYNAFGQLSQWGGDDQPTANLEHDALGQVSGYTDARRNRTHYLKDDAGRVVAQISPDTGLTTYRYDAAGNRIEKRSADGAITTYQWDAANRPISEHNPEGQTTWRYDAINGKLIETSNPHTTGHFAYNTKAQLIAHTRTFDGRAFTTGYEHDAAGRMHRKHLPDGQTLRYHYHASGPNVGTLRAITRETLFGLRQETVVGEIDLEAGDGASGYLSHNGVRTQRRFAADGRIRSIDINQTLQLNYTYDSSGQIVQIDENGIGQRFSYDQGRLTSANMLTGDYRFAYDATGNRVASRHDDPQGNPVSAWQHHYGEPGSGNRLVQSADALTGRTQRTTYNDAGSPLERAVAGSDSALRYEYNSDQRPMRVYREQTLVAEYAYNSFGERIRKVTYWGDQKRITYFLYDGHEL